MSDVTAASRRDGDAQFMDREQIVAHVEESHSDVEVMDPLWRSTPWMAHSADHHAHGADHEH